MAWIRNIDSLYDFIGYVVLCAPNAFPEEDYLQPEEQMNLDRAFEELREGIKLIEPAMMTEAKRRKLLSLLEASLTAYREGDQVTGAHLVQGFSNLNFKR